MPRKAIKAPKYDALEHGMWWVSRWISGSMNDPDWSWDEAETITVDQAFEIVRTQGGTAKCADGEFWRYICVTEEEADRLLSGGDLKPYESPFQSFTTSAELAVRVGEDLCREGDVHLVLRVDAPASCVMYSMADLLADRRCHSTILALGDWHHQEEVVIKVSEPMRVLEVRAVDLNPENGMTGMRF